MVHNIILHLLFLNNILIENNISAPFWSIGTEWHFYVLLPFLIYLTSIISIVKTVLILSLFSIVLFSFVNMGYLNYDWWESQILVRFPEFGVGIIAAFFYKKGNVLPVLLKGKRGIFFAVVIMFIGRFMKFTPVLDIVGVYGFLFKSIADTVMTSGFAILLYHVITIKSRISIFLSSHFVSYLGRISFSIYLWHSLCITILSSVLAKLPFKNLNPLFGFLLVILLTVPISHFSFKYLEASYFQQKNKIKII